VQTPILRECWTFLIYIFLHQKKAVSRICASKTRRNLQIFGWCLQFKQSFPWAPLFYFCLQRTKQGKSMQKGESGFKKNCLRKAQHYQSSLKEKKSLCKLNSLTWPPKNHNLFVKFGSKRELEKRKICDH
jgi:hypothetical protein